MTGLYAAMRTNRDLENKGIWLDLDHSLIKLARAGGQNVKFNAAAEKLAREHKRVFQLDLMSSAKGKELLRSLYAETIILDWWSKSETGERAFIDGELTTPPEGWEGARYTQGVGQPDGTVGDFTKANVIKVFTDIEDLLLVCKDTAESLTFFRQGLVEDIAGN